MQRKKDNKRNVAKSAHFTRDPVFMYDWFISTVSYNMLFTSEITTTNSVLTFCEVYVIFFPLQFSLLAPNPLFQNKIYFVTTWKVWIRFCLALVVRNTPYIVLQYIFIISIFKPLYINLHVESLQMKTIIIIKKAVDTISMFCTYMF